MNFEKFNLNEVLAVIERETKITWLMIVFLALGMGGLVLFVTIAS